MKIFLTFLALSLPASTVQADPAGEFAAAMELYQARKWTEARAAFSETGTALAAFYEMECLRRSGDLSGLAEAAKRSITPPPCAYQVRQIALYQIWEAVRTQDWTRVLELAGDWDETPLPGEQRVQVAWCRGLALEALKRPEEALLSYQTTLVADAGASVEITGPAALRILAIHLADPEVAAALQSNAPDAGTSFKLREAAAVAGLFQSGLGGGAPLPAAFQKFLTLKPVD